MSINSILDLSVAINVGLPNIEENLYANCDKSKYKVTLKTYADRDTSAEVYDQKEYDIILCLYYNRNCISSVIGRYMSSNKYMEILSKTNEDFEKRKYNLYLRTAFIYLMCFVPEIDTIYSFATNPISTYTMYKYYNASNDELNDYVETINAKRKEIANTAFTPLNHETFTVKDAENFHEYLKELSLELLEEELKDKSPEDLGFVTEEDAIRVTSKSISIPLHLSLKETDIKPLLLTTLQKIAIQCYKTGGTKKKRSKKYLNKSRKNKKTSKKCYIKRSINNRRLKCKKV